MTNTLYPVLGQAQETVLTSWFHVFVFVSLFFWQTSFENNFLKPVTSRGRASKNKQSTNWGLVLSNGSSSHWNDKQFSLIHESDKYMAIHTIQSKMLWQAMRYNYISYGLIDTSEIICSISYLYLFFLLINCFSHCISYAIKDTFHMPIVSKGFLYFTAVLIGFCIDGKIALHSY